MMKQKMELIFKKIYENEYKMEEQLLDFQNAFNISETKEIEFPDKEEIMHIIEKKYILYHIIS